jgi:hypothetical protein
LIHCVIDGTRLRIFRQGVHRPEKDSHSIAHDVPIGHYEADSGWDDDQGVWMVLRPLNARDVSRLRLSTLRIRWRGDEIEFAGIALPPSRQTQTICLGHILDALNDRIFLSVR